MADEVEVVRLALARNVARGLAAGRLTDGEVAFCRRPLARHREPPPGARGRVLLTAPHVAVERAEASLLRDPLTGPFFAAMARAARAGGWRTRALAARVHRRHGDQNRMWGLLATKDLLPRVMRYDARSAREADGTWAAPTLHVDVHSFFADHPLPGWGRGVNLIVLHGQPRLLRLARAVAARLRRTAPPGEEPPTVVEMARAPRGLLDDDANALCELSYARGAHSLLVEFPVRCARVTADDAGCAVSASEPPAALARRVMAACVGAWSDARRAARRS